MHPKNRTGMTFGPYLVTGRAGDGYRDWNVKCTVCEAEYVKNTDVLRNVRNRGSRNCEKCYDISTRPRNQFDKYRHDVGFLWYQEDGTYRSTEIGLMQQDFYLGRIYQHFQN